MKKLTALLAAIALGASAGVSLAKEEKKAEESSSTAAVKKLPAALKGALAEVKDGKVVDHKVATDKEFYVLYHSASWWGGCKAVTAQLVQLNKEAKKLGKKQKYQLILVGYDRKKEGAEKYMKGVNFPAIKFDKKKSLAEYTKMGETGFIPNIVMIDADGKMVTNDKDKVLAKLRKMSKG